MQNVRKNFRISLCICLLIIGICTSLAYAAPPQTYINQECRFSIQLPPGLEISQATPSNMHMLALDKTGDISMMVLNAHIWSEPNLSSQNAEQFLSLMDEWLKNHGYQVLDKKLSVAKPAQTFFGEILVAIPPEKDQIGKPVQALVKIITDPQRLVVLMYSSTEDKFAAILPAFNKSFASFKVLSPAKK